MGTGKRRSKSQVIRDRRRIGSLYLEGWIQEDIADEVDLSPATVSRDIKALQAQWLEGTSADFDEAKARELAEVNRLEREYYIAWRRSCEDEVTLTQKTKGKIRQYKDKDGVLVKERPGEATKTRKKQAGDPRFLQGVQWCIAQRCKILGVVQSWVQNLNIPLERLSMEQLERIAAGENPIRVLAKSPSRSDTK